MRISIFITGGLGFSRAKGSKFIGVSGIYKESLIRGDVPSEGKSSDINKKTTVESVRLYIPMSK